MKRELSVIDLSFLIKELKSLEGALVDKIYQYDSDVFIRVYKQDLGKPFLAITKRFIFLTKTKPQPTSVPGFGQVLRKYLSRATIKAVEQIPGQRVVKIVLQKEHTYHLYAELYGKSNIILCNGEDTIIAVRERQQRKQSRIAPKETYHIEAVKGLFEMSETEMVDALCSSQDNAQKSVALFVGKRYANELLNRAGIDAQTIPISTGAARKIYQAVSRMKEETISPHIYRKNSDIDDITPFAFTSQKHHSQTAKTLSETYARQYVASLPEQPSPYDKKIASMEKRIVMQKERMKQMQKSVKENQRKGELLYENYQVVADILESIKKARETLSWKEIKDKLKGHPIVKNIDEKNGKITIEL